MGRIVVGVDESAGAATALRWAVREADVRGWSLTAVLAWTYLDQHHVIVGAPFDPEYGEADAVTALDSIVRAAVGTARGSSVEQTVVNDHAAPALLDASEGSRPARRRSAGPRTRAKFAARIGEPAMSPSRNDSRRGRARRHRAVR